MSGKKICHEPVNSVQATVTLEATSDDATVVGAVSSTEDIIVAFEIASSDPSSTIAILSSPVVTKIPACRDDICSPGEARIQGAPPPAYDCPQDCPIVLGTCPTPGSSELGDVTRQCGGLGSCAPASLTCGCFEGYGGEACGHCSEGYRRVDDGCEVITSMLLTADPTPPGMPEPPAVCTPAAAFTMAQYITSIACKCTCVLWALHNVPMGIAVVELEACTVSRHP